MRLPTLPTARGDWRRMARTARLVLSVPGYAAVALLASVVGLTLFVFSLNLPLVRFALGGPLSLEARATLLANLYPFVGTGYGPLQGALLVLVAALLGVDVAMVASHLREHGLSATAGGGGAAGAVLGALGAGCAACGTALLAGVLSLLGVSTSLVFLPLDGLEFALLALAALVLSVHWVAEGMRGGEVAGCPVDP